MPLLTLQNNLAQCNPIIFMTASVVILAIREELKMYTNEATSVSVTAELY